MLSSYNSPWLLLIYLHFYDFVLSRMLYKWNHTVYSFLGVGFLFTQHISLEIHPRCCLYPYVSLLVAAQYSMLQMDHRVFNHSHTERHLGCFQALTIVNKAATGFCVNKSSYFSGINAYGRLILNRVQSISGFALFLLTPHMILMPSLGWCLSIYSTSIAPYQGC